MNDLKSALEIAKKMTKEEFEKIEKEKRLDCINYDLKFGDSSSIKMYPNTENYLIMKEIKRNKNNWLEYKINTKYIYANTNNLDNGYDYSLAA